MRIFKSLWRQTSFSLPTSISVKHSCLDPLLVRVRRWRKSVWNWILTNKDAIIIKIIVKGVALLLEHIPDYT